MADRAVESGGGAAAAILEARARIDRIWLSIFRFWGIGFLSLGVIFLLLQVFVPLSQGDSDVIASIASFRTGFVVVFAGIGAVEYLAPRWTLSQRTRLVEGLLRPHVSTPPPPGSASHILLQIRNLSSAAKAAEDRLSSAWVFLGVVAFGLAFAGLVGAVALVHATRSASQPSLLALLALGVAMEVAVCFALVHALRFLKGELKPLSASIRTVQARLAEVLDSL